LAVHGRANLTNQGGEPPLKDIHPHADAAWNIAVAHASIARGDLEPDPEHDYYISAADVERSGADYVALGHWHKFEEYFVGGRARVFYSGSPESLQFKDRERSGYFAEVRLETNHVQVIQRRIGRYHWFEEDFSLEDQDGLPGLQRRLDQLADPAHLVRVRVVGRVSATESVPLDALEEGQRGRFAYLQLQPAWKPRLEAEHIQGLFPPGTIGDTYVKLTAAKLATAHADEREVLEEALRRGAALLAGEEEVE
jgi:DNA repair exonuclease SbcCD nuclease subunit